VYHHVTEIDIVFVLVICSQRKAGDAEQAIDDRSASSSG
jgi:hypothetical protein